MSQMDKTNPLDIIHYKVTTTDREGPTEPDARAGMKMQPMKRIVAVGDPSSTGMGAAEARMRLMGSRDNKMVRMNSRVYSKLATWFQSK